MIHRSDIPAILSTILNKLPELAGNESTAPMLPRECYTSAEFFEFEQKLVFARSWMCVGREEQITRPGDYLTWSRGEPLLVVRAEDRMLRAMSAVCQHRGQILATEAGSTGHNRAFICPLHQWTYGLNGQLLGAPHVPREQFICLRETVRLPQLRVELWHGFIFVNLDVGAPPLAPSTNGSFFTVEQHLVEMYRHTYASLP